MLRQILKFYTRRNFSNSAIWKEMKKEVTNTPQKEAQTTAPPPPHSPDFKGVRIDFVPNELDKFILVYSGKYKSKDEIPPRISHGTLDSAKSKARIKLANYLMVATVLLCCYYIWQGKKRAKAGESIVSRGLAYQKQLREEAGKKHD